MFYYLEACATVYYSFFFLTEGAAGSLFAANIKCSSMYSSIGFGFEKVASLIASAMNLNAKSTRRIGATSTETW